MRLTRAYFLTFLFAVLNIKLMENVVGLCPYAVEVSERRTASDMVTRTELVPWNLQVASCKAMRM